MKPSTGIIINAPPKMTRKKGETGVQDRTKPQPMQKKDRDETRKKKKLDRAERQRGREG
jgi:hypothetical protein